MASALKNLSVYDESTMPDASGMTIGIAVADWNASITHALYEGCVESLRKHGVLEENIHTAQVPGSFELPVAARMLIAGKKVDAVICLGCVIKGDTDHDVFINQAVASGLTNLSITSGKPCIFGVLTTFNEEQAVARAGGEHGNKGIEAAITAIRMVALAQTFKMEKKPMGF